MALTQAQLLVLKNDIIADPALNSQPDSNTGTSNIAAAYNSTAVPDFPVWNTSTPISVISTTVDGTKYTPVDAPDGTLLYNNRCFLIQIKQSLLSNILQMTTPFDASLPINRANLRDAVIAVPAGSGGALISAAGAGGKNALTACLRLGTRYEKLFSSGTETTGVTPNGVTGGIFGVDANGRRIEGQISTNDIELARALP